VVCFIFETVVLQQLKLPYTRAGPLLHTINVGVVHVTLPKVALQTHKSDTYKKGE